MDDCVMQEADKIPFPSETRQNESAISTEALSILNRIKNQALLYRLRVCEFFKDFDPLRIGSITVSQFRRGLSSLGLSALGHLNMTEKEFKTLASMYQDPAHPGWVLWSRFNNDVDAIFTIQGLEKSPLKNPNLSIADLIHSVTVERKAVSPEQEQEYGRLMERLKGRVEKRRILIRPWFQDFDRHNNGHVTQSQFRQCMSQVSLDCSEEELALIELKFMDSRGFDYYRFLVELEPYLPEDAKYEIYLEQRKTLNKHKSPPEIEPLSEVGHILDKIKKKVVKERIRVMEFMKDYDKLNSGRILKNRFGRALDLCGFGLKPSEVAILQDAFQSPVDVDYVNYRYFSNVIEAVFTTKGLLKAPLVTPVQLVPTEEVEENILEQEQQTILQTCLKRLAEKVYRYQMQLFPLFEDYDTVHNGTVSRSQFFRVLSELGLAELVSGEEEEAVFSKFKVLIGCHFNISYIAFCENVYKLAGIDSRKP